MSASYPLRRAAVVALVWLLLAATPPDNAAQEVSAIETNVVVRVVAANLTSGNYQSYEGPGVRILQGLKPDVVAVQEFKYNNSSAPTQLRQFVDLTFGTNFHFYCEPAGALPNGIVSRWSIIASGSWDDPKVSDRGFAWAVIDHSTS